MKEKINILLIEDSRRHAYGIFDCFLDFRKKVSDNYEIRVNYLNYEGIISEIPETPPSRTNNAYFESDYYNFMMNKVKSYDKEKFEEIKKSLNNFFKEGSKETYVVVSDTALVEEETYYIDTETEETMENSLVKTIYQYINKKFNSENNRINFFLQSSNSDVGKFLNILTENKKDQYLKFFNKSDFKSLPKTIEIFERNISYEISEKGPSQ